jgi:hypothetical protein
MRFAAHHADLAPGFQAFSPQRQGLTAPRADGLLACEARRRRADAAGGRRPGRQNGKDRMTVWQLLPLLAALVPTACVSTGDEPFSLDDSDAAPAASGGYVCVSYDAQGERVAETHEARLVPLRRNKKTQYAFVDDETSSAEPFTLHRAKGNFVVVSVAHADAPGEDLYLAEFADAGKEFRLYAEGDGLAVRAQGLAGERGVTFAHNQFSNDLAGPVDAQKAFMIELASDPKGWKLSADCRAKR